MSVFFKDLGVTIKAHSFILVSRSPVFEAMFYGSLTEAKDCVEIPDISPEAFKNMLE